jgi:hypothetical protein
MEYPTTNINENLIGAGLNTSNPQNTYVDFATQLAKNSMDQKAQEEAIANAKLMTKQAQIETAQQEAAQNAGINPLEAQYVPKAEALVLIKKILEAKGEDASADDMQQFAAVLPNMVNRADIDVFASRFMTERAHTGTGTLIKDDQPIHIPKGKSASDIGLQDAHKGDDHEISVDDTEESDGTYVGYVPQSGMYQTTTNNKGEVLNYTPGGREATDNSLAIGQKQSQFNQQQWKALETIVDGAFKTRSGGLGSLSTAVFRAVRAINTLTNANPVTKQDLANISQDIAGIYQGGAPTVVSAQENSYETLLTNLADTVRKNLGVIINPGDSIEATKNKLMETLTQLRDSASENIREFINSTEPAFRPIITAEPERWKDLVDGKMKFIESGLLIPNEDKQGWNISGMTNATKTKNPNEKSETGIEDIHAFARAAGLKKKKGS